MSVTVRLLPVPEKVMPAAEIRVGLDDTALITRLAAGVSTSDTTKPNGPAPFSSSTVTSGSELIKGRSFTAVTVTTKLRLITLFDEPPSFRVTVIRSVPDALVTVPKRNTPVAAGLV